MGNPSLSSPPRVLLYVLRNDLRLSDNPILYDASRVATKIRKSDSDPSPPICHSHPTTKPRRKSTENPELNAPNAPSFAESVRATHLLPVYIFPANHIEVSGFLQPAANGRSPYPEARSRVGGFWRTGPHRAKFLAESAWDLKDRLEAVEGGSGLVLRAGAVKDVVDHILSWFAGEERDDSPDVKQPVSRGEIVGVCITSLEGTEEKADERHVRTASERRNIPIQIWKDEKYFVDDDDLPFTNISDLPNVYTTHRKSLEPLRDRPRRALPTPSRLPPLPEAIPPQQEPFHIPSTLQTLIDRLQAPLEADASYGLPSPPRWPSGVSAAHPFSGGETAAQERVLHLISSGSMTAYKETRNGMLGLDFSTKLSAYLALGCLTARQVHWRLVDFEEGRGDDGKSANGYGKGENDGTKAVRFELLWRDYMRLCARKFGANMFHEDGIQAASGQKDASADDSVQNEELHSSNSTQRQSRSKKRWRYLDRSGGAGDNPAKTRETLLRFFSGTTGVSLIDASNRELFLTGYTSNRARQNVASFLAAHLGIDWRLGAEWYECWLIDYDMPNNWGNWEYVAGVGNDPRQGRVFNPVKQALDYDPKGEYVRAWVPELRGVELQKPSKKDQQRDDEVDQEKLMGVFQPWRLKEEEKDRLGLKGLESVEWPLVKIPFSVGRKSGDGGGRGRGRGGYRGRGRGRGIRRLGQEEKATALNEGDT